MNRGEIWWARLPPPEKLRPVLLVSRQEAYAVRELVMVAPLTRRVRAIAAEIRIGHNEGLPGVSAANCDTIRTVKKGMLVRRIGGLAPGRMPELDSALRFAFGLD
jgi:mRNA interferase MazF